MTADESRRICIALLIDAENVKVEDLGSVLTSLRKIGDARLKRAYGDWSKASLSPWKERLLGGAIEPIQQFDVKKGKNAADIRMCIDAMELLYSERIDAFALFSSDSDFSPLALVLRQHGCQVFGFGEAKTPENYRKICTKFEILGTAVQPSVPELKKTAKPAVKAPIPPAPVFQPEHLKSLEDAIRGSSPDDNGYARLGTLGKQLNADKFNWPNGVSGVLSKRFKAAGKFFELKGSGSDMRVRRKPSR